MGLTGNRLSQQKWSVESVHSKNLVAILHLLVSLARHFRAPIRLPENVTVNVVIVQVLKSKNKCINNTYMYLLFIYLF